MDKLFALVRLQGRRIKPSRDLVYEENMAILAYVLFKLGSGTEREVAEN